MAKLSEVKRNKGQGLSFEKKGKATFFRPNTENSTLRKYFEVFESERAQDFLAKKPKYRFLFERIETKLRENVPFYENLIRDRIVIFGENVFWEARWER